MLKRILHILLWAAGGLVFLLVLAALVSQTQPFRDGLRSAVLSALDSTLEAETHLGDLTGNLVTGFSIDGASIKVGGSYLLVTERIDIRYDLFQIPGRRISVKNVRLVRPSFQLLRGEDGRWNFERMVRTRAADTAAAARGGPFDWWIAAERIIIEDGNLFLVDSTSADLAGGPADRTTPFRYGRFGLSRINLDASGTFARDFKRLSISSLSFATDHPGLSLDRMTGDLVLTDRSVAAHDLLIRTENSELQVDALLDDTDLLAGLELAGLRDAPVSLSLRADDLDLRELARLLPAVDFLHGLIDLDLSVGGTFGELAIRRLRLVHGRTDLTLTGMLGNLDRPENLFISARSAESSIAGEDVMFLLDGLDLPDLSGHGDCTLNLEYDGRPLDFSTKFHVQTAAGTVSSPGFAMTIGGPSSLAYRGEVLAREVDPGRAFRNPALAGSVNLRAVVDGRGVSIPNMRGTYRLEVEPSTFLGHPVGTSTVDVAAADTGIVGRIEGSFGETSGALLVHYNPQLRVPSLALGGGVTGLNLQDFLGDSTYNSSISMSFAAEGAASSWDDLSGEFHLNFEPSRWRQYTIGAERMHLTVDQHDRSDKKISFRSRIADFSLVGAFNTDYVIDLIDFEARNLSAEFGRNFAPLDSGLVRDVDRPSLARLSRRLERAPENLDAEFAFLVKDLEAVALLAGTAEFNGSGILTGRIRGNYDRLALDARLGVKQFVFGTAQQGFLLEGASARLVVDDLQPVQPLKNLMMDFSIDAARLHVNEDEVDSLRLSFIHEQELASFAARGVYGKTLGVDFRGNSAVTDAGVLLRVGDLGVRYRDAEWRADAGATASFTSSHVQVAGLTMRRDDEEIRFDGRLEAGGALQALVDAQRIDLDALNYLLDEDDPAARPFAGVGDVALRARGTLQDPRYDASVSARAVTFRGIPFGALQGTLAYEDHRITTDITVASDRQDTVASAGLTVTGTIPADLSPAGPPVTVADSAMNLAVVSHGMQINVLDPLVGALDDLTGTMTADLAIVGSPRQPDLRGFLRLEGCRFLFTPNNIVYTLDGEFEPAGSRVRVANAWLRNVEEDDRLSGRDGELRITGDFALRDFVPGDFQLRATGQLLVVKEATVRSALGVSGNLFVEVGNAGLRFTGEIDSSVIGGSVLVRNSTLLFPPTRESGGAEARRSIPFIVVEDTSHVPLSEEDTFAARYFRTLADTLRARRAGGPRRSFVDGMHYDLDVETSGGNTRITMLFDARTEEKLEATLEGRFSIQRDGRWWLGDLRVEKAFYNFYKRFDAQGGIRFIGPLLNPELDIRATYRGTRVLQPEGKVENVLVTAKITGERSEPKLAWEILVDDVDYASYSGPKSNDIQNDAITFIIAGTFATTDAAKNEVATNLGASLGNSVISGAGSLLTGRLSDFLRRETGFINAVDFTYGEGGSFSESADVRISATVGDGVITYGGRIFQDPFSNANVGILYSVGSLANTMSLRNLMVQLEHKVDTFNQTNTVDRKEVNSARLFYRFSF